MTGEDTAGRGEPPRAVDLAGVPGAGGVVWSVTADGFHSNLVVLAAEAAIAEHRNDEIDVLVVVLAGDGQVIVDGSPVPVGAANAILIPRGAARAVVAGGGGLRYLTMHQRRGPLTIGPSGSGRPT